MRQLNISYEAKGGAGCLILYGVTLTKPLRREECLHARDETLAWLETTNQPIIYTQNWRQYDDSEIETRHRGERHRTKKARSPNCRQHSN